MKNKKTIFKAVVAAAVVCMGMIFYYSSQDAVRSDAVSRGVSTFMARIIFADFDLFSKEMQDTMIFELNMFIRKLAHFSIFFIMGAFVYSAFAIKTDKLLKSGIISTGLCLLYACLDEFHQYFTPGRTPLAKDVAIDTFGAALGALFCFFFICILRYLRSRKNIRKNIMMNNNSSPPSAS